MGASFVVFMAIIRYSHVYKEPNDELHLWDEFLYVLWGGVNTTDFPFADEIWGRTCSEWACASDGPRLSHSEWNKLIYILRGNMLPPLVITPNEGHLFMSGSGSFRSETCFRYK